MVQVVKLIKGLPLAQCFHFPQKLLDRDDDMAVSLRICIGMLCMYIIGTIYRR